MDVWSEGSGSKAVMEALRKGRNSSWSMPKNLNLSLSALYLEDETGKRLMPGDDSSVTQKVKLYAGISEWMSEGGRREELASKQLTLRGDWIVDGRVVANIMLPVDNSVSVTPLELMPGPHVVRLRIPPQKSVRMEANPFLLRVKR